MSRAVLLCSCALLVALCPRFDRGYSRISLEGCFEDVAAAVRRASPLEVWKSNEVAGLERSGRSVVSSSGWSAMSSVAQEAVSLKCEQPFMRGVMPLPCGRCKACRVRRSRNFATRAKLEWYSLGVGSVATLTYAPKRLPLGGHLDRRDLQLHTQRLRNLVGRAGGPTFRVAGPGEYGSRLMRPHYHQMYFGLGTEWSQFVKRAWSDPETGESLGHVHVDALSDASIDYCCGYMVKGMHREGDARLGDLVPEFFVYPRRPGLGVPALDAVAAALNTSACAGEVARRGDVPGQLRFGRRLVTLDRTMLRHLRERCGLDADLVSASRKGEYLARCEAGAQEFGRAVWCYAAPMVPRAQLEHEEARRKIFVQRRSV